MTMLDRAARAARGADLPEIDYPEDYIEARYDRIARYERIARAVIETLMELDVGMVEAFYSELARGHSPDDFNPISERAIRAMLRHVLEETP